MAGFVYLIQDKDQNTYKIGVTRGSTQKRLKRLQTGNSSKIELVYSVYTNYPFKLESMLHTHFKEKRGIGEWFYLNKEDIDEFLDLCFQKIDVIETMKDNPFFGKNLK